MTLRASGVWPHGARPAQQGVARSSGDTLTEPTESTLDIAIIGAGAAGLMGAIAAASAGEGRLKVMALDGAPKIGAKILISGGGRCNVTHDVVTADDFHGSSRALIAKVLRSFDVPATLDFFASLGVTLKREEGGKLFPETDRARTVLDALLREAERAGALIRPGNRVSRIEKEAAGFRIFTHAGSLCAASVIIATGGRSVPKTGSDGSGYSIVRALGHSVTETRPALVPLLLPKGHWLSELSGVSAEVELTVASGSGKGRERRRGAMLLTHFGLSGPVVLDISRFWIAVHASAGKPLLTANFFPDRDYASLDASIRKDAIRQPHATAVSWLSRLLPARLAEALVRESAGIPPEKKLNQLAREERKSLIHTLVTLELPVIRDRGFDYAEVTAGGVPLTEVRTATLESKLNERLYLCGEILDVDGWIGGYNFQWAWASGRLAGLSAAKKLLRAPDSLLPLGEGGA